MPEKHIDMLRFYLDFWLENRDILLGGKLVGYHPECSYTKAVCTLKNKSVIALYTDNIANVKSEKCIVVNAGTNKTVIVKTIKDMKYRIVNCFGEAIDEGVLNTSITELSVPVSGVIFLD
jgi:alpha-galactosidase